MKWNILVLLLIFIVTVMLIKTSYDRAYFSDKGLTSAGVESGTLDLKVYKDQWLDEPKAYLDNDTGFSDDLILEGLNSGNGNSIIPVKNDGSIDGNLSICGTSQPFLADIYYNGQWLGKENLDEDSDFYLGELSAGEENEVELVFDQENENFSFDITFQLKQ